MPAATIAGHAPDFPYCSTVYHLLSTLKAVRIRPVRWDGPIILLCYFAAFWLCVSPIIPYQFQTDVQLYVGTMVLGTPLAVVGVWLNHLAEKAPKKD